MTAPTGVLLLGLLLRSVLAAVVAKLMTVVSRHVYAVSPAGGSANLAAQKDPLGSAINATMQQVRAVGFIIVRDVTASYATVSEVNARGTVVWGRALHRFLAFTITRLSFCFTRPSSPIARSAPSRLRTVTRVRDQGSLPKRARLVSGVHLHDTCIIL